MLKHAAAAFLVVLCAHSSMAQEYPTRPITLVVGNPAGGGSDVYARILARSLEKDLGRPIVVENRPGQGSALAAAFVARAQPDGYTLMMPSNSTLAINPSLYKKLSYDPMKDFSYVSLVGTTPFVLVVNPSLQVNSFAELVALAKKRPAELNYASSGIGSVHHVMFEKLKAESGIDVNHVPYRGGAPALADVVAGHIPMMFADAAQVVQYVAEGKLKALGISSAQRLSQLPNVPTLVEAGVKDYDAVGWFALVGPAGLPASVVSKLRKAVVDAVESSEAKAYQAANGMKGTTSTPEQLREYVGAEIVRWRDALKASGTQPIE